jgi:glucose-6-phosphate isomerase
MTNPTKEFITHLDKYQDAVDSALSELSDNKIISRVWSHDHTVWKPNPAEITNRLGWLDIAERMSAEVNRMITLKNQLITEGYTHALLLGMGGSSLAPEVFSNTFRGYVSGLELSVLDSTDPDAIIDQLSRLNLRQTVFIVSTKSGGTVETLSLFKFFYNQVLAEFGEIEAGSHFIAITDPNSKLEGLAEELNFRQTFLNDPNIGGRFSVMSFFGLVPAALVGLDITKLIEQSIKMAQACRNEDSIGQNPAALLGAIMGILNRKGLDKITFVASPGILSFCDWVEQLIAESTGKAGKGILPVVRESMGESNVYANDRIFVHLRLADDEAEIRALKDLAHAGHPVLILQLNNFYELGAQFFLWEFATAIASYFLKINPFDQPNVESAKVQAQKMVAKYEKTGKLPVVKYQALTRDTLASFLANSSQGDYISLQAYINPTPEAEKILSKIRHNLRDKYKLATTLGFGPRFLHSTGQLHKGDAGNGLFIQFTSETQDDLPIPDHAGTHGSKMSFQTLKISQALGDAAALEENDRRLIRIKITHIQDLQILI